MCEHIAQDHAVRPQHAKNNMSHNAVNVLYKVASGNMKVW
jgi:hypothetical protein